ncbi:hypothetical protein QU38_00510, partial [Staphylococcus aureus]
VEPLLERVDRVVERPDLALGGRVQPGRRDAEKLDKRHARDGRHVLLRLSLKRVERAERRRDVEELLRRLRADGLVQHHRVPVVPEVREQVDPTEEGVAAIVTAARQHRRHVDLHTGGREGRDQVRDARPGSQ